jgi:hypothetical protein
MIHHFTENGEGTWVSGRDRMTKDGMVLKSLAPWDLRKNMVDGRDLHILPLQDAHFCHLIPRKKWHKIPPVHNSCGHFMQGERVQVTGHQGIVVNLDRSFNPGDDAFDISGGAKHWYAEMKWIYSETATQHILCHSSFIVKQHQKGDTSFSFGLRENVIILGCDFLKQEVTIRLRATTARKYQKEPLVSQFTIGLLSTNQPAGQSYAPELFTIPALAPDCGLYYKQGPGMQAHH